MSTDGLVWADIDASALLTNNPSLSFLSGGKFIYDSYKDNYHAIGRVVHNNIWHNKDVNWSFDKRVIVAEYLTDAIWKSFSGYSKEAVRLAYKKALWEMGVREIPEINSSIPDSKANSIVLFAGVDASVSDINSD